jgi:hypothetical protein
MAIVRNVCRLIMRTPTLVGAVSGRCGRSLSRHRSSGVARPRALCARVRSGAGTARAAAAEPRRSVPRQSLGTRANPPHASAPRPIRASGAGAGTGILLRTSAIWFSRVTLLPRCHRLPALRTHPPRSLSQGRCRPRRLATPRGAQSAEERVTPQERCHEQETRPQGHTPDLQMARTFRAAARGRKRKGPRRRTGAFWCRDFACRR